MNSRPRADPQGRRCGAEAPEDRRHRPLLPASRRPQCADRGRGRHGAAADQRRQGQAFRPFRSRRRDHPQGPCGTEGRSAAERVFAVVARAGGRNPAAAGRARHRLRTLQPARQGFPHRRHQRRHHLRQPRISAMSCRASRRRRARPIRRWSISWARSLRAREQRRRRSRSPGCWRKSLGSCRSPAPPSCHRLEENIGAAAVQLTSDDRGEIDDALAKVTIEGDRYPAHLQARVGR